MGRGGKSRKAGEAIRQSPSGPSAPYVEPLTRCRAGMCPGLSPFLEALRLPAYACTNCGFWQRHFEPPTACPMCLDARHVVPGGGWRFLPAPAAQAAWPTHWEELERGAWRFWNEPVEGIGPNGYLLRAADGRNVFFEGASVFSAAALDHIAGLGGIDVLSASHPHSYGALWQLQERFDPGAGAARRRFTAGRRRSR